MWRALLPALLLLQDDPAALIEKLRSDDIEVREAASKRLKELGPAAKPALEKAAKDPNGEVAARAAHLLRILQLKAELTPNLQMAIPDAAERLARDSGAPWTEVLLEAAAVDGEFKKHRHITRADLEGLVTPALKGAGSKLEKITVCWMAAQWRLKSALPEMRKLTSDPDVEVRRMALVRLSQLGRGDAADVFSAGLKDGNSSIRQLAVSFLGSHGTPAHVEALRTALEDPDTRVRLNAAKSLAMLGDRSAVPMIVSMLEGPERGGAAIDLAVLGCAEHADKFVGMLNDSDSDYRWYALIALECVDARDRAEEIAKSLEKTGRGTPGIAAKVLAGWKLTQYSDRIAALVKDKPPGVYSLAVTALGLMDDSRHAKVLLPVLKDSSNYMRANAAESLERLDARDAAGDIAALLKDPDALVRWTGAICLGKLASRMTETGAKPWIDALRESEKDDAEAVRLASSISLVRLKARSGADALAIVRSLDSTCFESWRNMVRECTLLLLQLHESAGLVELRRPRELKRSVESPVSLAATLKDAGLNLLNPGEIRIMGRVGKGRTIDLLEILTHFLHEQPEPIIEKGAIRLVTQEAALEYWLKRLQAK